MASTAWWTNIYLGFLLWFFYCTDYSLPGTTTDIAFPFIVAVAGIIAIATVAGLPHDRKRLARLACIPSLVGGLSYMLMCGLLFLPPFTLGALFLVDSIGSETLTQQVASPNGLYVAEVYTRPGGYSGAYNKPLLVRVKSPILPVVERDIYGTSTHDGHAQANNYVSWEDNDTLRISETGETISLGLIKPEVPQVIAFPFSMLQRMLQISSMSERLRLR